MLGNGYDPQIFVWSFAWWPHAIATWTNPFVTHAVYAPSGVNLAWTASAPGLALAFSPLTVLFGPVASYNVAMRAAAGALGVDGVPALPPPDRLDLGIGRRRVLFGFSAYVLGEQLLGHLHLTGVFLLPLVALVVVRYVEGELDGRGLAWRLGVLVALQLWISTEVAFTLTLALVLGLVLAFWLVRDARPRLRSSSPRSRRATRSRGSGGAARRLTLIGFVPRDRNGARPERRTSGTDLLNFVVPTKTDRARRLGLVSVGA